jgi:hypothetical protein
MGSRAFDPLMLERVDQALHDDDDEISFVEACTICGEHDLVFEDGVLVDLEGVKHRCPER